MYVSNTMKIQYLTTNFVRKLRTMNEQHDNEVTTPKKSIDSQIDQSLMQYFNHDLVLLPFFFDDLDQNPINDNHKHMFTKNP